MNSIIKKVVLKIHAGDKIRCRRYKIERRKDRKPQKRRKIEEFENKKGKS